MILCNVYKGFWYKCNEYIASVVKKIDKKLEELANEFFFTDSVKFGWNGRLE